MVRTDDKLVTHLNQTNHSRGNMSKYSTLFTASAIALAMAATPAFAQVDDEIIVTATKRQTTLQDTPVAVSVTNSLTIERAKILDIQDLQSVVPSLRVNQLQTSQNTNFEIRGSGNGANNGGIESSVGVFIDGVYRSRSSARVNDLPKLERVEVLKGPQSTLFGKNASAGVISIVTAEPSFESEGYIEGTYGNYDQHILKAYLTGPINDSIAFSLGGGFNKRDGYFESADEALPDTNDRDRHNIRGQLLFEPTENVKFRLIGDYSSLDESCCGVTNVVEGAIAPVIQILSGLSTPATADVDNPFEYTTFQNSRSINEINDYGVSFHADVSLKHFDITSISSYRANDSFYVSDADYSRAALLDEVGSDLDVKTFTQEIRLTSNTDGQFDWMLGGFLFEEDVDQGFELDYGAALRPYINFLADPATGGASNVLGTLEALTFTTPGTFASADVEIIDTFNQSNTALSLFGTVDFHVSDDLTITGGLNYTDDKKRVRGTRDNPDAFSNLALAGADGITALTTLGISNMVPPDQAAALATAIVATPCAPGATYPTCNPFLGLAAFQTQPQFVSFPNSVEDGKSNDSKLTWQIRGNYAVNDDLNVYASASTGFKATSWDLSRDSRPFAADFPALLADGLIPNNVAPGSRNAGPEKVTVYELGLKAKLNRGFVNVALFDQTFKGLQTNAFVGTTFQLTNAGELSIKGIEVDGAYEIFDGFRLNGAVTLLDPEFTDFKNASGPIPGVSIDRTGERPDNVSKTSVSLGGTYEHDFDNGMEGYIRADWQYEGPATQSRNLTPDSLDITATAPGIGVFYNPASRTTFDGYDKREQSLVNGSIGVKFENGLGLQIWGRNLFNDEYFTTLFPGVFQFGNVNAYPNQPRTYGVTARYDF